MTASFCAAALGCDMSTTCRMMEASWISSRVALGVGGGAGSGKWGAPVGGGVGWEEWGRSKKGVRTECGRLGEGYGPRGWPGWGGGCI